MDSPLPLALNTSNINAALSATGWVILEVTVNTVTGFARLVAERRDADGRGMKVVLHRGATGSEVVEMRDIIERKPGMYRDFWEIVDGGHMGRRRHTGFRSALRNLANYIDDNRISAIGSAREALRPLAAAVP